MSYNIKGAFHFDNPKLQWANRKEKTFQIIRRQKPDIIGLQEVMDVQLNDFKENFPEYTFFGKIRSEEENSEHATIGYLKEAYELLESDTFWLSDTPEVMSNTPHWKSACYRVATWGKFKEKNTGKIFFHLNTHFDHTNEYPRYKAARLVSEWIKKHDGPIFLTGDFNGEPYERFYEIITSHLNDYILHSPHHVGPKKTCNATDLGNPFMCEKMIRIDYIFGSKNVEVLQTEVCTDSFAGEFRPSDHFPVVAILNL